jgi:hypothetical protein
MQMQGKTGIVLAVRIVFGLAEREQNKDIRTEAKLTVK